MADTYLAALHGEMCRIIDWPVLRADDLEADLIEDIRFLGPTLM